METPLDAEFSLIRQRRADAGLGWLTAGPEALPSPLEVMGLAEFEPDVWIPSSHVAARRGTISLAEMARMDVIYGPRRAEPGTYDAWTQVLRTVDSALRIQRSAAPALAADEPRLRRDRGPAHRGADRPQRHRRKPAQADPATPVGGHLRMVRVTLEHRPLAATAALVWSGDLPRTLQQILFDTAESIVSPGPARQVEPELEAMSLSLASWPGAVGLRSRPIPAAHSVERGWR